MLFTSLALLCYLIKNLQSFIEKKNFTVKELRVNSLNRHSIFLPIYSVTNYQLRWAYIKINVDEYKNKALFQFSRKQEGEDKVGYLIKIIRG